jgi:hypothetical protein
MILIRRWLPRIQRSCYDTERRFFKSVARNADNTLRDVSIAQALLRGVGIGMLNASTEAFEETSQDVL